MKPSKKFEELKESLTVYAAFARPAAQSVEAKRKEVCILK